MAKEQTVEQTETTTEKESQENQEKEFNELDSKTQTYVKDLREESAKRRNENKILKDQLSELTEFKTKYEVEQKKKLEDDGKLKDLLDLQNKELDDLKEVKITNQKYEGIFKLDLDNELKGLSEGIVEVINGSGKSIADQLELAKKIKKEVQKTSNSPASERAGGNGSGQNLDGILEKIRDEKDLMKKSKMLTELKTKDPELYKRV